jgi:heterodisulfide reductase subunit B
MSRTASNESTPDARQGRSDFDPSRAWDEGGAEDVPTLDVSYFPGCSGHSTGREYEQSARIVCAALEIQLHEIEDWSCCGATSAHATDEELAVALGARNLCLAEAQGLAHVVTPCAACFSRLKHAQAHIEEHGSPLGLPDVTGSARVVHLLDLLADPGRLLMLERLRSTDLGALAVVPYYGCLITRPPAITGSGSPENPTSMDLILERIGVQVKRWPYKTRCCGSSLAMTRSDLVEKLCTTLVSMAVRAGAEAIVAACPLCFVNLDTRQRGERAVPIFYFTELMALSMGLDGARKTLRMHHVSPVAVLESKGVM